MGIDPRPHSLRDVWEMACGLWDRELDIREFWSVVLGGSPLSADQRREMHPLRRTPKPAALPTQADREREAKILDELFIPED